MNAKRLLTLFTGITFVLYLTACKKYEDGPYLSLSTKKARITNQWLLVKKVNSKTKIISNYPYEQILDLKRDNSFILSAGTTAAIGEWQFGSDKESLVLSVSSGSGYRAKILRLTRNELWLQENDGFNVYDCYYENI
jgi:hypothetical protein